MNSPTPFDVEVYFDGECPLCIREIGVLRLLDRKRRRIRFTDIAEPDFDAAAHGVSHDDLMAKIHGRLPDGRLIEGVEVFRRLYDAVGFGLLVRLTRLPLVAPALDAAYLWFAANRLHLTGRCTNGGCKVPHKI